MRFSLLDGCAENAWLIPWAKDRAAKLPAYSGWKRVDTSGVEVFMRHVIPDVCQIRMRSLYLYEVMTRTEGAYYNPDGSLHHTYTDPPLAYTYTAYSAATNKPTAFKQLASWDDSRRPVWEGSDSYLGSTSQTVQYSAGGLLGLYNAVVRTDGTLLQVSNMTGVIVGTSLASFNAPAASYAALTTDSTGLPAYAMAATTNMIAVIRTGVFTEYLQHAFGYDIGTGQIVDAIMSTEFDPATSSRFHSTLFISASAADKFGAAALLVTCINGNYQLPAGPGFSQVYPSFGVGGASIYPAPVVAIYTLDGWASYSTQQIDLITPNDVPLSADPHYGSGAGSQPQVLMDTIRAGMGTGNAGLFRTDTGWQRYVGVHDTGGPVMITYDHTFNQVRVDPIVPPYARGASQSLYVSYVPSGAVIDQECTPLLVWLKRNNMPNGPYMWHGTDGYTGIVFDESTAKFRWVTSPDGWVWTLQENTPTQDPHQLHGCVGVMRKLRAYYGPTDADSAVHAVSGIGGTATDHGAVTFTTVDGLTFVPTFPPSMHGELTPHKRTDTRNTPRNWR